MKHCNTSLLYSRKLDISILRFLRTCANFQTLILCNGDILVLSLLMKTFISDINTDLFTPQFTLKIFTVTCNQQKKIRFFSYLVRDVYSM